MSYRSYTYLTDLIQVLKNLFLCECTRRYDKSELIIIVSHTRSDQTYSDTYQIWTLVHSRYGSQQIHIPDLYRFRTYPITNKLSVYHNHIQSYTCSEAPIGTTGLILISDVCSFRTPVGVTELILIQDLSYVYLTT